MRPRRIKHISHSASSYLEDRLGLNPPSWDCLKSASAQVQVLEEFFQVPDSPEEETRQDRIRAEARDPAEVSAQAAEWAERLAFLHEEPETARFSDAIRETTDTAALL
jgi:hypothetical protein